MESNENKSLGVNSQESHSKNVVDLATFKRRKGLKETLSGQRSPLYATHLQPANSSNPKENSTVTHGDLDFASRLDRIKNSLEKINHLMSELKKISHDQTEKK